jgi:hypothetical protein
MNHRHKISTLRPKRPGHGTLVAYLALFLALGGTGLATTQGFILGTTNSVDSASKVTNVKPDSTQNTITSPLLTLENLTTGTGATAVALNVASGHAPFTTNSATKVTNLNADEVDGLHSSSFVTTSGFRRVGPLTGQAPNDSILATIGNLTFKGHCYINTDPVNDPTPTEVELLISSAVDHSAYASMTQPAAGSQFGSGDMSAGTLYQIADVQPNDPTALELNPVSGSAIEPNGHQITFDLYQGMNVRNQPGQCIFGGTFAVK